MREDVPRDTQGVYAGRPSFCPFAYRKPGHSAKQPLGWSSHEPHVSIAFRPISDAETVGPLAAGLRRRECFGRSAGEGAARGLQRTRAAERLLRTTDRRAEVHHRLDEIAGPIVRHHGEEETFDVLRLRITQTIQPRCHPLDVGVDGCGALAESNRGDRCCGIRADTWKLTEFRGISREFS